jgi:hypothetical protein
MLELLYSIYLGELLAICPGVSPQLQVDQIQGNRKHTKRSMHLHDVIGLGHISCGVSNFDH